MNPTTTAFRPRISILDSLRGMALVAMTVYHFTWDLEFFRWVFPNTITQPGWVAFARAIAFSFLFVTGISLVLAHENGIRWRKFGIRLLQIVAAAALITVATYFVFKETFIFFGILHAIALFSVFALPFVRWHWLASALAAAIVLAVWWNFTHETFNHPALWWIGLSTKPPLSNDYVPTFPWFAAVLSGVATAKLFGRLGFWDHLSKWSLPSFLERPTTFIGRHSLIYYLIHQPILLALIWCFTAVAGPPNQAPTFTYYCERDCNALNDEKFCKAYCGCMSEKLSTAGLLTPFMNGQIDVKRSNPFRRTIDFCQNEHKKPSG